MLLYVIIHTPQIHLVRVRQPPNLSVRLLFAAYSAQQFPSAVHYIMGQILNLAFEIQWSILIFINLHFTVYLGKIHSLPYFLKKDPQVLFFFMAFDSKTLTQSSNY